VKRLVAHPNELFLYARKCVSSVERVHELTAVIDARVLWPPGLRTVIA
jgi:hypothetical protein